jgi:putative sterol carrier protein
MALFGSEEWLERLLDNLNSNEDFSQAASDWEGDFIFIVTADGALEPVIYFYVDLWHGKARSGRILKSPDEVESAYTFKGLYSNWLAVMNRELDPLRGLLAGKFELEGDMAKVLKRVKAAQEMVNTIIATDTELY